MTRDPEIKAITDALAEPFDPKEVKFKPQMVKNNKALAIAYIDVRLVEDRLDHIIGGENWQDSYEVLNDGSVVCRLAVRFPGQPEWVTKTDVGTPSEQPDGGDRLKAAFSDAMKRAAIKFGIGRYLYRLPAQWVDYDPAKKQIIRPPQLPAFALPRAYQGTPAAAKPQPSQAPEEPLKELTPEQARAMADAKPPLPAGEPSILKIILADIKQTSSLQELAAVWEKVRVTKQANRITADEFAAAGQAKDDRKRALQTTAPAA
jgi:hypothetical protein